MSQTFYKTEHLTINQKLELLNRCFKENSSAWVDERKPGEVSRVRSELTFREILIKLVNQPCHFVFIDRGEDNFSLQYYFEVGFSTLEGSTSYFLFIYITPSLANELIGTFNLQPM